MGRNIVPRTNRDASLGTPTKYWDNVYANKVITNEFLLEGSKLREGLVTNITVTVGNGGDFPNINTALNHLVTTYYPTYLATGSVPSVTIKLLTGFVMAEQVKVKGMNLGWITITGDDAETTIQRSALTSLFVSGYPAFGVIAGTLPIIDQLFAMDTSGDGANRHGIAATLCSSVVLTTGSGVKNVVGHGIYANNGSIVNANGANVSGAGSRGIYASNSSTVNADGVNVSGATGYGIEASNNSMVNANNADVSNVAGIRGIYANHGSIVNANGANVSGAGGNGIEAIYGSTVNANGANVSGAGNRGIFAVNNSIVNASSVDASNTVSSGIYVYLGSIVNASGATGSLSQTANTITANGIIFQ